MAYTLNEFKLIGTPADKKHIRFWESNTDCLPNPITPDIDRLTENELNRTAFKITPKRGTQFYVDNSLIGIVNKNNWEKYVKACFLTGYFSDMPYTDYRRYFYRWDKEAKHTGKNNTYVRTDYLRISIGAQNKVHRDKGVVTIRANGSIEGNNERYSNYMSLALPCLVRLQQGPGRDGRVLLDILDIEPIKDHSIVEGAVSRYFDLHHILVRNSISSDKTVEPTMLLSRCEFIKLRHSEIIELLKCIVLVPGLHKEIHRQLGANSGFLEWQQLYNNNKIKMLPYYLLNEHNYNETIDWLSTVCVNFDKSICVTYGDFISSIS